MNTTFTKITPFQVHKMLEGVDEEIQQKLSLDWMKKGYIREELNNCPLCGKLAVGITDWKGNSSVACSDCSTRIDFYANIDIAIHVWNNLRV